MTSAEKNRENKIRDRAADRGYRLIKANRLDKLAIDFAKYLLVPFNWNEPAPPKGGGPEARLAFERGYGLTMDEMEAALRLPLDQMAQLPVVVKTPTGG
jgi:hypothetical protein